MLFLTKKKNWVPFTKLINEFLYWPSHSSWTNGLSAPKRILFGFLGMFYMPVNVQQNQSKHRTNRQSIHVYPSVEPAICGLSANSRNKCISPRSSINFNLKLSSIFKINLPARLYDVHHSITIVSQSLINFPSKHFIYQLQLQTKVRHLNANRQKTRPHKNTTQHGFYN